MGEQRKGINDSYPAPHNRMMTGHPWQKYSLTPGNQPNSHLQKRGVVARHMVCSRLVYPHQHVIVSSCCRVIITLAVTALRVINPVLLQLSSSKDGCGWSLAVVRSAPAGCGCLEKLSTNQWLARPSCTHSTTLMSVSPPLPVLIATPMGGRQTCAVCKHEHARTWDMSTQEHGT